MKTLKSPDKTRAKAMIAFTQQGRTLAIPQEMLEEASGKEFSKPPFINFEIEKGHTKSYIWVTARRKQDDAHKWKAWKSNVKSRRFYVSILSVLAALDIQGAMIQGHETKGKIIDKRIRITLKADFGE
jgi:hypothetical protein